MQTQRVENPNFKHPAPNDNGHTLQRVENRLTLTKQMFSWHVGSKTQADNILGRLSKDLFLSFLFSSNIYSRVQQGQMKYWLSSDTPLDISAVSHPLN